MAPSQARKSSICPLFCNVITSCRVEYCNHAIEAPQVSFRRSDKFADAIFSQKLAQSIKINGRLLLQGIKDLHDPLNPQPRKLVAWAIPRRQKDQIRVVRRKLQKRN